MPILSSVQMRNMTGKIWNSNFNELYYFLNFCELFELYNKQFELHIHGCRDCIPSDIWYPRTRRLVLTDVAGRSAFNAILEASQSPIHST